MKNYTMPTHNKHIFMLPKKVVLILGNVLIVGKCAYLGK